MALPKNLIGQKFGNLTVTSEAIPLIKNGRKFWNCKCSCGNDKIVQTNYLTTSEVKSCGCLKLGEIIDVTGKKINMLFVILKYHEKNRYLCNCNCGNVKMIEYRPIEKPNPISSCGCLKLGIKNIKVNKLTYINHSNNIFNFKCDCGELSSFTYKELEFNSGKHCKCMNTIYDFIDQDVQVKHDKDIDPYTYSARRVWRKYIRGDKGNYELGKFKFVKFDLLFDKFYEISQQNCIYCNQIPNLKYNFFENKPEGLFIHNTLDRKNSSTNHSVENCVAACLICNKGKSNLSVEIFLNHVNKLQIKQFTKINIQKLQIPKNILNNIEEIQTNIAYKDNDLDPEEFYWLIQQNCFYCNSIPKNKRRKNSLFLYNGLDRVDSKKTFQHSKFPNQIIRHSRDNVVTCCKICNFMKSDLTLDQFNDWINRIQYYQDSIK